MPLINVTKGELQSIYHPATHLPGLDIFHYSLPWIDERVNVQLVISETDYLRADVCTHSPATSGGER